MTSTGDAPAPAPSQPSPTTHATSQPSSATTQHQGVGRQADEGMVFKIYDVDVYFPYSYIYPEQFEYMCELHRALRNQQHCMLEMPTGTGKTIALLSFITSYQLVHPEATKLIYCTRTVGEMEKALEELRELVAFRKRRLGDAADILAVGLSSRKNLCIHPVVSDIADRQMADEQCRLKTASWVRQRHAADESVEVCTFYDGFERIGMQTVIPRGVYTMEELRDYGRKTGICPYFLSRYTIRYANVVVYNYAYLLDPKISQLVSKELERECIVVFDEAHNIDNVCIEALSVNLDRACLNGATRNLAALRTKIEAAKASSSQRLQDEYQRLVQGLRESGALPNTHIPNADVLRAAPTITPEELGELVPGDIRKADMFVGFMRRVVDHLKTRLAVQSVEEETPTAFVRKMVQATGNEAKSLRFAYDRLKSLLNALEIADIETFKHISLVSDFCTLVSSYQTGFSLLLGDVNRETDGRPNLLPEPMLQLACLDASLCIKPVFERFNTVVITSGTLSPINFYPKILNFSPLTKSLSMSLSRDCIHPMIVSRGSDQLPVSSSFKHRDDRSVLRNYGVLIVELCKVVPDGMVVFFTSYRYMEQVISTWHEGSLLKSMTKHKLLFMETKDVTETSLALDNFKRACDCGRGALFFSVARGKVSEGIDFDRHYGRCVVLLGVPYQYTESRTLKCRLRYMQEMYQVPENEFLTFDAIRQASQCVGRVIRSKNDYGVMIFADQRFHRADKKNKLPGWILNHLHDNNSDMSVDMAVASARTFLRQMSQPQNREAQIGTVLLSETDLAVWRQGRE